MNKEYHHQLKTLHKNTSQKTPHKNTSKINRGDMEKLLQRIQTLYDAKMNGISMRLYIDPFIEENINMIFTKQYFTIIEYLISHYTAENGYFDDIDIVIKCREYAPQYCRQIVSCMNNIYLDVKWNAFINGRDLELFLIVAEKFSAKIYRSVLLNHGDNKLKWLLDNNVPLNKNEFYSLLVKDIVINPVNTRNIHNKIKNRVKLTMKEFFLSPEATFPQYALIHDHFIDAIEDSEDDINTYNSCMDWLKQYCSALDPNVVLLTNMANEKDVYMVTTLDIRHCREINKEICRYINGKFVSRSNSYQFTNSIRRYYPSGMLDVYIIKILKNQAQPSVYFQFDRNIVLCPTCLMGETTYRYHIVKLTSPLSLQHLCEVKLIP